MRRCASTSGWTRTPAASFSTFSQLAEAKNRAVYDSALGTTLPGTLVRSEGSAPIGITDANQAYDFAGQTYDYLLHQSRPRQLRQRGRPTALVSPISRRARHPFPECVLERHPDGLRRGLRVRRRCGGARADATLSRNARRTCSTTTSPARSTSRTPTSSARRWIITNGVGNDGAGVRWQLAEDLSIGADPPHDDAERSSGIPAS